MINLMFSAVVAQDPTISTSTSGNPIAVFPVLISEEAHVPPSRLEVVAQGRQAIYARDWVKKHSNVIVGGWFFVETRNSFDHLTVKARYLKALTD